SHTTRPARAGERDGKDYHFVDRAAFDAEVAAHGFLEWAEVYGNCYGTHRQELELAQQQGVDLLLDIDIQGARAVRTAVRDAAMILILPPSWKALEQRLRGRGTDDDAVIERRLAQAKLQLEGYALYDYLVVNDDLERACAQLEAIVIAERLRLKQHEDQVQALLSERG